MERPVPWGSKCWTLADDELLRKLAMENYSSVDIAIELKRSIPNLGLVALEFRLALIVRGSMPVLRDILPVIPMGEENAVTAQLLWKQLNLWSFATINHKLNEMAAAGLTQRKRVMRKHDRLACITGRTIKG